MKIFKYSLHVQDHHLIQMPKRAKILTVQTQNGTPCIWAKVDETAELETREFAMFRTGHTMADDVNYQYIGTFTMCGDDLVFHLFEIEQ